MNRRRLTTDADMPVVALRSCYRQPQHLQHPWVTFVEVERHKLRIPIDTQCQLRQIDTALQPVLRHCLDYLFGFHYAATERHQMRKLVRPIVLSHTTQRFTLQREAIGLGRVRVTRRDAEAEHRIGFGWLERGGDSANTFGQGAHKEFAGEPALRDSASS